MNIVCENVAPYWKTLAFHLKIPKSDTDKISREYSNKQERCWALLRRWYLLTDKRKIERDFLNALTNARHRRMADIVNKLLYSSGSVDEILAPHVDREGGAFHELH